MGDPGANHKAVWSGQALKTRPFAIKIVPERHQHPWWLCFTMVLCGRGVNLANTHDAVTHSCSRVCVCALSLCCFGYTRWKMVGAHKDTVNPHTRVSIPCTTLATLPQAGMRTNRVHPHSDSLPCPSVPKPACRPLRRTGRDPPPALPPRSLRTPTPAPP